MYNIKNKEEMTEENLIIDLTMTQKGTALKFEFASTSQRQNVNSWNFIHQVTEHIPLYQ
jgi:hypothetical protein